MGKRGMLDSSKSLLLKFHLQVSDEFTALNCNIGLPCRNENYMEGLGSAMSNCYILY